MSKRLPTYAGREHGKVLAHAGLNMPDALADAELHRYDAAGDTDPFPELTSMRFLVCPGRLELYDESTRATTPGRFVVAGVYFCPACGTLIEASRRPARIFAHYPAAKAVVPGGGKGRPG